MPTSDGHFRSNIEVGETSAVCGRYRCGWLKRIDKTRFSATDRWANPIGVFSSANAAVEAMEAANRRAEARRKPR